MPHDPHPWATDLATLRAQVWTRLVRGVRDRRAAARHPTLATVSAVGLPEARTVVLRAADPAQARLEIHSDVAAAKVAALRATPWAALHVWDAGARLQIRLTARVQILDGAEVAETWVRLPPAVRAIYGPEPTPGTPVPSPLAPVSRADPGALAVLCCTLETIEALHLGQPHRRARFKRAQDWAGQWLVP